MPNIYRALQDDIDHWRKIISGEEVDSGTFALCSLFRENACLDCPIESYRCACVPYADWILHHQNSHRTVPRRIMCPKCTRHAKEIVHFLKELLAKEQAKMDIKNQLRELASPLEGDTITLPSINIEEELWAVLRREAIAGRMSCILTTKDSRLMDYYICLLNRADIEHKAKDCRTIVVSW